jgi:hypothetical protein
VSLRDHKTAAFDEIEERSYVPEPTEEEYKMFTQAARSTGIIKDIFPYETESTVMRKARSMLSTDVAVRNQW